MMIRWSGKVGDQRPQGGDQRPPAALSVLTRSELDDQAL